MSTRTFASSRGWLAGLLAAVTLVGSASAVRAAVVPLSSLLDGQALTLGDKRFSNFTFSSTGDDPVSASNVDVDLTTNDNNRYNLRFSFSREALAAPAERTTDVVVCYQVDVIGNQRMNGVGLVFDSTIGQGSPGLASASVTESISAISQGGEDIGQLTVRNDGPGGLGDTISSNLAVNPPAATLYFCKDIIVSSRAGGGLVTISTVDNIITQVPEPTSAALLGVAAIGLLARRRRGA